MNQEMEGYHTSMSIIYYRMRPIDQLDVHRLAMGVRMGHTKQKESDSIALFVSMNQVREYSALRVQKA